eukprot:11940476-Ditylum_brightwellii.AAC.1
MEILLPKLAIKFCRQDDKTGISVGRNIPIQSASHQSSQGIVPNGTLCKACDHEWTSFKLMPSVIVIFPNVDKFGKSFYMGSRIITSMHDAAMKPSTGLHHNDMLLGTFCKDAQKCIKRNGLVSDRESINDCMPYIVLIKVDSSPDHNLTALRVQLYNFGLFLVGNKDKLTFICGCPGLSYLSTAKQAMLLLNIGRSNLSLSIDPDVPDFLMSEVINNALSMAV